MDVDFLSLILAIIGGDIAIIWEMMKLKDEIADNRVRTAEHEYETREEFAKCHSHPCTSCSIKDSDKNE